VLEEENGGNEMEMCRKVLDRVLEIGVKRLRVDDEDEDGVIENSESFVEESELMSLRKLVLNHADVFDALNGNIEKQIGRWECEDSGLAVKSGDDDLEEDVTVKVLFGIQKMTQVVHLDVIRESIEGGDVEGAISHLRFLHFDYGLDQSKYRYASF
jgi:zinc finger FYVE domain-containing protein 26